MPNGKRSSETKKGEVPNYSEFHARQEARETQYLKLLEGLGNLLGVVSKSPGRANRYGFPVSQEKPSSRHERGAE